MAMPIMIPTVRLRPSGLVIAIAAIWTIDLVWTSYASIRLLHLGPFLIAAAILGGSALLYRRLPGGERAAALAEGFIAMLAVASGGAALSYLSARFDNPLADQRLASWDAALGFNWLGWYRAVLARPLLLDILQFAYSSMATQISGCLLLLPLSGRIARNREFIAATALALLLTIGLFALFPAASAWVHYGVRPAGDLGFLQQLQAMRSGHLTALALDQLDGIITFPSFHVATAVLVIYAARGTPLLPLAVLLNTAMILSTPAIGGHYGVDVLGGAAVALLAIGVVRAAHDARAQARAMPAGAAS